MPPFDALRATASHDSPTVGTDKHKVFKCHAISLCALGAPWSVSQWLIFDWPHLLANNMIAKIGQTVLRTAF